MKLSLSRCILKPISEHDARLHLTNSKFHNIELHKTPTFMLFALKSSNTCLQRDSASLYLCRDTQGDLDIMAEGQRGFVALVRLPCHWIAPGPNLRQRILTTSPCYGERLFELGELQSWLAGRGAILAWSPTYSTLFESASHCSLV